MIGSLFAGISGLNANATAMTVIGDNIANVNTTGFKSNRASFANVLSTSLQGSGGSDVGRGVAFWGSTPSWSQGSVENTANATDMAINGRGFFMVNDQSGQTLFTRAGEFAFDRNGNLLNPDGLAVQGYEVTSVALNGALTLGAIMNIGVPSESTSPPVPTDEFTMDINLDAGAAVTDTYSSSQVFYDSLGNAVPVTFTFTRVAAVAPATASWNVAATIPASAGTGAAISAPSQIGFNALGNMITPATDATVTLTLTNGATSPQPITWSLYNPAGPSLDDITGYASTSVTTFQTQNGYPAGSLRGVSVDELGVVTGAYSNGQMTPLYQVAMADFPSYYGLSKMGNNLYAESLASGQALPGVAQSGRLGSISPSAIEMSNVDLAQEFVKMITTQRAFQANSRVITTSDEILNELINIKR
jgi:flagellar hook protein FlgE